MKYTLGRASRDDPYHVDIIREKLMRSLTAVLPDVIDELSVAVPEYIPAKGDGACDTPAGCAACATTDGGSYVQSGSA